MGEIFNLIKEVFSSPDKWEKEVKKPNENGEKKKPMISIGEIGGLTTIRELPPMNKKVRIERKFVGKTIKGKPINLLKPKWVGLNKSQLELFTTSKNFQYVLYYIVNKITTPLTNSYEDESKIHPTEEEWNSINKVYWEGRRIRIIKKDNPKEFFDSRFPFILINEDFISSNMEKNPFGKIFTKEVNDKIIEIVRKLKMYDMEKRLIKISLFE